MGDSHHADLQHFVGLMIRVAPLAAPAVLVVSLPGVFFVFFGGLATAAGPACSSAFAAFAAASGATAAGGTRLLDLGGDMGASTAHMQWSTKISSISKLSSCTVMCQLLVHRHNGRPEWTACNLLSARCRCGESVRS